MTEEFLDGKVKVQLTLWEAAALATCLKSTLQYTHNPGICPRSHREKLLALKAKLVDVLPDEILKDGSYD